MENTYYLCSPCTEIIRNTVTIDSSQGIGHFLEEHSVILNEPQSFDRVCQFCLGIMNPARHDALISEIKQQISQFEQEDFKLTCSFTPLAPLFHFPVY